MAFQLQDIDPETDFQSLARCLLDAYQDPPQRFLHILLPVFGPSQEAREAAIQEAGERLKLWHSLDPSSHWQKAVDVTGKIVGGAAWNIHRTNPFAEPHPMEATWFPNDSSRTFAEKALENYGRPRFEAAQRPHLYLFNVFVHPDFRRKGVGQKFLDWGMNRADELGLEFFLDATPQGKPLYDANGFIVVEENVTAPTTDNPDEKWKETEEKVSPFTFWLMWRPVGGKYEEGKTIKPWESA
ncbi:hypothetical protein N8I77_010079 [Diaporthe amygdali]|uniref:N-acetyltransferase domain-containing protein n=1 Tax=Phomopsis amygdali TaxID=1214568 RepID=A0AAD9S945_PHOAM|nr:hypothetical protein N8I77_010079 [Diaporthe amygdali]